MTDIKLEKIIMDLRNQEHPERDNSKYDLLISVSRHGPKDGLEGPLTDKGRNTIREFYQSLYRDLPVEDEIDRKLISSPIKRAKETAEIFKGVLADHYDIAHGAIEEDERLSEQNLVDFIKLLPQEQQHDWFRYWYTSKQRLSDKILTGNEAVRNFSTWLLDQIENQLRSARRMEINAFSHGPVMAAFILRLEEQLSQDILGPTNDRLNYDRLFAEGGSEFMYLSNLRFYYFHANPEKVLLSFHGRRIEIPLSLLKHLVG